MKGGKQLLLLAVCVLLARCQQKPKVSMSPEFKQIFSGDLLYLSCDNSNSGNAVKWYFNNIAKSQTKTWKIAVADPHQDSGSYQCESNGQKSDSFLIDVMDYAPSASLIIKTGQPVMRMGDSVVLKLSYEDGLQGWKCWVYKGKETYQIILRLKKDNVSLDFQTTPLTVPESIFWCTDSNETRRSNHITVRTSGKDVALEMTPLPAVPGDSLTLTCLAWGTDQINRAVFYKDNIMIHSDSPTYKISNVGQSAKGSYKCDVIYTHRGRTEGPPYQVVSDNQDLLVRASPMKAVLTANVAMSCSCPDCSTDADSYRWYYKNDDGQPWKLMVSDQRAMMPKDSGIYACRAMWNNKRSFLSNSYVYQSPIKSILIGVVIVLVILCVTAVAFYICYKKRNTTGPIYEDVGMSLRDKGDQYETLQQPRGAEREGEYHTLHPEAPGRVKKEGEYQSLKTEGMKEGEYNTLGMEGAGGGAGGYEALKKEGMKEGEYNTLGMEGAGGGAGGYEALKKEGMKEGVYHTLGMEGAGGGEGGREAVGNDRDRE